jgi:hypothetical protein
MKDNCYVVHSNHLRGGIWSMNQMEYTTSSGGTEFSPSFSYPETSKTKGIYGSFRYRDNSDGTITIDPNWVNENVVEVMLPGVNKTVQIHKLAAENFTKAFQFIVTKEVNCEGGKKALLDLVKHVGSPFVPRHVGSDTNRALSNHSWGIAIDINEDDYPMGEAIDTQANPNDPNYLLWVHAFQPAEFIRWGNEYKDPMHFELTK